MSEPCQVCGNTQAGMLVEQGPHRWVSCPACRFAWLSPMPTMDEAEAVQDAETGQAYIDGYLKKLESKMRRSRKRVAKLKRHMPGKRLLDIGSNIGCLVAAGAEQGLDATGVEINPVLAREAQRRYPAGTFLTGAFEEVTLPHDGFDGVYCSEVIEHVVDTNRFLHGVASVMAPGGAFYLTTPALREYTKGSDPARWRDFGAPDHKLYFSPDNIQTMLEKHGFKSVRIAFNFGRGLKLLARWA
jgi:2-polyprenyl-3-methyl-5-hydroxy-6-metoxy-1,4-benzoquinol methylase